MVLLCVISKPWMIFKSFKTIFYLTFIRFLSIMLCECLSIIIMLFVWFTMCMNLRTFVTPFLWTCIRFWLVIMPNSRVTNKIIFIIEPLLTPITFKRFFGQMQIHMSSQTFFMNQHFIAYWTLEFKLIRNVFRFFYFNMTIILVFVQQVNLSKFLVTTFAVINLLLFLIWIQIHL